MANTREPLGEALAQGVPDVRDELMKHAIGMQRAARRHLYDAAALNKNPAVIENIKTLEQRSTGAIQGLLDYLNHSAGMVDAGQVSILLETPFDLERVIVAAKDQPAAKMANTRPLSYNTKSAVARTVEELSSNYDGVAEQSLQWIVDSLTDYEIAGRLKTLSVLSKLVDRAIEGAVADARELGLTWEAIGGAIGLSTSGAHRHFDAKARQQHAEARRKSSTA